MARDSILLRFLCYALLTGASAAAWRSQAREADQFTDRMTRLPALRDSAPSINGWVNARLDDALAEINASAPLSPRPAGSAPGARDEEFELIQAVERRLLDPVFKELLSPIEVWLLSGETRKAIDLDRARARGIYAKTTPMQVRWSFLIGISYTLNVSGNYVGEDKIGHFFAQGHQYFEKARTLEAQGLNPEQVQREILQFGHEMELHDLGYDTTGIYSPADLAANWSGWKFWKTLTRPDTDGTPPLLQKVDGQWTKSHPFRIEDFASPAWDEFLNPPFAANGRILAAVRRKIRETCSDWTRQGISPPVFRYPFERPGLSAEMLNEKNPAAHYPIRFDCSVGESKTERLNPPENSSPPN